MITNFKAHLFSQFLQLRVVNSFNIIQCCQRLFLLHLHCNSEDVLDLDVVMIKRLSLEHGLGKLVRLRRITVILIVDVILQEALLAFSELSSLLCQQLLFSFRFGQILCDLNLEQLFQFIYLARWAFNFFMLGNLHLWFLYLTRSRRVH